MLAYALFALIPLILLACYMLWDISSKAAEIHEILSAIQYDLRPLAEEARERKRDAREADRDIFPEATVPRNSNRPVLELGWTAQEGNPWPENLAQIAQNAFLHQGMESKMIPDTSDPELFWVAYRQKPHP
jgi:hypothetical protein